MNVSGNRAAASRPYLKERRGRRLRVHVVVMRIVGFDEFCSLPDGTVFSYWEPCIASGLYRRGKVISFDGGPKDFFEASLIAESYNGEPPEVNLIESRWGIFNYDQQFAVYSKDDIAVIAEGLGLKSDTPQVRYSDRVRGIRADCLPPEILELAIYGEPLPPPPAVVDEISRLFTQQPRAE